eukprot:6466375-Amphidinium_carterae.2
MLEVTLDLNDVIAESEIRSQGTWECQPQTAKCVRQRQHDCLAASIKGKLSFMEFLGSRIGKAVPLRQQKY